MRRRLANETVAVMEAVMADAIQRNPHPILSPKDVNIRTHAIMT
jgi:hypothetical protein